MQKIAQCLTSTNRFVPPSQSNGGGDKPFWSGFTVSGHGVYISVNLRFFSLVNPEQVNSCCCRAAVVFHFTNGT